jgi:type II secretory pathway component PulF
MTTTTPETVYLSSASAFQRSFAKLFFGGDEKTELMKELGEMMDAGFALNLSLRSLWMVYSKDGKEANAPVPIMLGDWYDKIQQGAKFSEAVKGWFPHAERMIFIAAEQGGAMTGRNPLGSAFRMVGQVSEVVENIKSKAWSSLKPIGINVTLMIVMLGMYAYLLVPQLDSIRPPDKAWTGVSYSIILAGEITKIVLVPALIALLLFIVFVFWSLSRLTGRIRIILDEHWPWSIYRMIVGSQFILAAAAMLRSGAADKTVLELFEEEGDPYLIERIQGMRVYVKEGKNLGFAMREAGFNFPDSKIIDKLRIYGSMSSDFGKAISMVGEQWLNDGASIIKKRIDAMEARMNMIVSFVVAWLALGSTFMTMQLFEWMKPG